MRRPAKNLKEGDIVFFKIVDTSDQASKIVDFLKQKYKGKIPELRLPIAKIEESETERLNVFIKITANIQGVLTINKEVKIKIFETGEETETVDKSKDSAKLLIKLFAAFLT